MWSSQTHSKTKSLVNIKFTRLFELALPTRLVGVTGFEPALALPSRTDLTSSSHVVSALRHSLSADTPCFVGKNFEKTPTGAFFLRFLLIPNRQKTVFLTLYSHFRRFSLGQRCSCVLFLPLFSYVPDLFVVKYVVVLHCPRFIQQRIPMISP